MLKKSTRSTLVVKKPIRSTHVLEKSTRSTLVVKKPTRSTHVDFVLINSSKSSFFYFLASQDEPQNLYISVKNRPAASAWQRGSASSALNTFFYPKSTLVFDLGASWPGKKFCLWRRRTSCGTLISFFDFFVNFLKSIVYKLVSLAIPQGIPLGACLISLLPWPFPSISGPKKPFLFFFRFFEKPSLL